MTSHEIDYTIHGDDLQAVEVELDPQETVIAEAGAMNWMDPTSPSKHATCWLRPKALDIDEQETVTGGIRS